MEGGPLDEGVSGPSCGSWMDPCSGSSSCHSEHVLSTGIWVFVESAGQDVAEMCSLGNGTSDHIITGSMALDISGDLALDLASCTENTQLGRRRHGEEDVSSV